MPKTKEPKPKKRAKSGPVIRLIPIDRITADAKIQCRRRGVNEATVASYAEKMKAGVKFMPVIVYLDEDGVYWLADGFHRLAAAADAGITKFRAEIRKGTRRDALHHAAGANDDHGLVRTPEDKWHSVWAVIEDDPHLTQREVAGIAGVTQQFVSKVKKELRSNETVNNHCQSLNQNDDPGQDSETAAEDAPAKTYGDPLVPDDAPEAVDEDADSGESDPESPPAPASWRNTPVVEAVEFKSRKVAEAVGAITCGDLADRLKAGDTFGLPNRDLKGLLDRVDELATAEAPPGPPAHATPDEPELPAADPSPPAEHPADAFAARVSKVCHALDAAKAAAKQLAAEVPYGGHVHFDSVALQIEAARKALWQSRPTEACNCVRDGSDPKAGCKACFGTGRTTPARVLKGGR